MYIKEQIHSHFINILSGRILMLNQTLADLKESGSNETKSTAGDKHETALAMLQIEQANTRAQLHSVLEQMESLLGFNPAITTTKILPGSFVKTNRGNFYISVALGKSNINGEIIMAISPESPLGAKLFGCSEGDSVAVNDNIFIIAKVE